MVSVFLLSAIVVTAVVAQPRVAGVSAGDWFKYGDITGSWNSNDPNAVFPMLELNHTEWMRISVEDVSGTNITIQYTWLFTNGTEKIESGYIDVDTGEGNMTFMAISANLNTNDTIYSSPSYSTQKINETIVRTYPDGVRDTNHMNMTIEYNVTGFYQYLSMNWYWDRVSGIFVEMSQEATSQSGNYTTTYSVQFKIVESSVWVVPEFPLVLILPLFMTATLLAVIVYRSKHPCMQNCSTRYSSKRTIKNQLDTSLLSFL
jgi:hypothetical protein